MARSVLKGLFPLKALVAQGPLGLQKERVRQNLL
jgi:hypothetical protein